MNLPAEMLADVPAASTKHDGKKVTIYMKSEMMGNIVARKARLYEVGTMKYAQYDRAPFAVYTPFRKRNKVRHVASGFRPFLLVVEGWDAPEPGDLFGEKSVSDHGSLGKVEVSMSRHSSFDEGWVNDFNALIDPLIESGSVKVVADYRGE